MTTHLNKKIATLTKVTADKRQAVMQRALTALQTMQENTLPINFESVASYAGVSKVWLYSQPDIRATIIALREKGGGSRRRKAATNQQVSNKEAKMRALINKNKVLAKTVADLQQQLEIVYGELYKVTKAN